MRERDPITEPLIPWRRWWQMTPGYVRWGAVTLIVLGTLVYAL